MKGRCPTCGKGYEITTLDELPSFPFCSPRCRLIDQARWADGSYVLPGSEPRPSDEQESGEDETE